MEAVPTPQRKLNSNFWEADEQLRNLALDKSFKNMSCNSYERLCLLSNSTLLP